MQHLRRDYNLISGEITKDVCNPAGSGLLDRYMKYISKNMLQWKYIFTDNSMFV